MSPLTPPHWTDGEFVTTRQVAQYLQMDIRTVQRYAREGAIPVYRVGGRYRFKRSDVEAFVGGPDNDAD